MSNMFSMLYFDISDDFALTPNCPRPRVCLFLNFGQAIVIRELMLNF